MSALEANWVSILTPPGRGAVAVVAACGGKAIAGVDAHFVAANGRSLSEQSLNRILFGHWCGEHVGSEATPREGHPEEVVVCRVSDDTVEVHCHGGPVAVERITQHLIEAGCQINSWQQRIEKHAPDTITAEAQIALAQATTLKTSAVLLQQHGGALKNELETIQHHIESNQQSEALQRVTQLVQRVPFGLHLTQPWRVVIAGRPNVGKSSLINALAGFQRAIVYDQPGTTRDVVSTATAFDGWPVTLSDVAGLRETGEPLEAAGIALARETIAAADLVLWVAEVGSRQSEVDTKTEQTIASEIKQLLGQDSENIQPLIVLNKCDQLQVELQSEAQGLKVSALTGEGIPTLIEAIVKRLVPSVPKPNEPLPFTKRQAAGLDEVMVALETVDSQGAKQAIAQLLDPRSHS